MPDIPTTWKPGRYDHAFLWALFLTGIAHWIVFFLLVRPEGGGIELIGIPPWKWFEYRVFNVNDQFHDMNYMGVLREALRTFTIPFHVPDLGKMNHVASRFFGATTYITSPQIILLYWFEPMVFMIVNQLLMYSIGFYGCLLLRRRYHLGIIPFAFLFLVFNFNGYFVEKTSGYGSWELGYFLMPYFLLLIFWAAELRPDDYRSQIRLGIWLGLVLAGITHQGSLNLLIHCTTLIVFWGVVNYRLWRFSSVSILVAFSAGFMRLLPMTLTRSTGVNTHYWVWGGYATPEHLVQGLVGLHGILDPPQFAWHEFSLYVGLPGLFLLVYFGIWAPFMRFGWTRFCGWSAMAVPCILMVVISCRHWKHLIIPNWIPFLNGEGTTMRYMIIPLLIVAVIAAVNFQGFVLKYWSRKRVRYLLIFLLTAVAAFLFTHSSIWRMHKVQHEFDSWIAQHADEILSGELTVREYYTAHHKLVLHIRNDPEDVLYIAFVWIGLAGTCLSMAVAAWWLWNDWRRLGRPNTKSVEACSG